MEITFKPFDINNPPIKGARIIVKTVSGVVAVGESIRWPSPGKFFLSSSGFSGDKWKWDFDLKDIVEWADITDI